MVKNRVIVLLVTIFVFFTLPINGVFAQSNEYVIKFTHADIGDPLVTSNAAFSDVFKMKVEAYTNNRVKVNIFPDGQLGDQVSIAQQITTGEIEMGIVAGGVLSSLVYEPISFESLPYIFPSSEVAEDVLVIDNPFIRNMREEIEKKSGIGLLSICPIGYRSITNNKREIKSPDDMKGLKFRVMQVKPHIEMINATGAQAVPIPYLEVYTSLQTGVIDGQENPISVTDAMNFQEVQKYLTLNNHVLHSFFTIYNAEYFNKLPEDIKNSIYRASKEARIAAMGINHIRETATLDKFRKEGINIYIPSEEELQKFKETMQPNALEWYKQNVENGEHILNELQNQIDKAEEKYKTVF
jgi:TRAP-type transport system periplasmic protein